MKSERYMTCQLGVSSLTSMKAAEAYSVLKLCLINDNVNGMYIFRERLQGAVG